MLFIRDTKSSEDFINAKRIFIKFIKSKVINKTNFTLFMTYTDYEYEIFSRQFILKVFTEQNIEKLEKSKISIVGIGGIGCSLVYISSIIRTKIYTTYRW